VTIVVWSTECKYPDGSRWSGVSGVRSMCCASSRSSTHEHSPVDCCATCHRGPEGTDDAGHAGRARPRCRHAGHQSSAAPAGSQRARRRRHRGPRTRPATGCAGRHRTVFANTIAAPSRRPRASPRRPTTEASRPVPRTERAPAGASSPDSASDRTASLFWSRQCANSRSARTGLSGSRRRTCQYSVTRCGRRRPA
jgi:hypothetical protein